ncbi:MAG TPA: TraB/GumN family protein [Candidatus Dormibacteraeota bacterium]|nr:TraB/GumN family protein [Candidatus Dormibacteraeota bacterium]
MRLRKLSLLLPVFLVQMVVLAQTPKPKATQLAHPNEGADAHHSLWKVQGKSKVMYLLGSIHVLKDSDYPLPPVIETAFSNSQVVAFEADIEQLSDPAQALKMMSKGTLPDGETLETQLTPETYKLLTNHLNDSGMSAAMVQKFTPGMAAMMLEVFELMKLGLNPEQGLDKHFYGLAKEQNKEILPLETVEFQMGLLTGFSKEEGEALMKTTLKQMDSIKKDLDEMLKAWRTGDSAGLAKLLNEAMADSPAIYKRLLTDRNKNWIPKLEELLNGQKNAIVIVGAGHLVGKEGVVELLKSKGWKITQL